MAICNHEWKPRPSGLKEVCVKCGAARKINPGHERHEGQNITLHVHDVKNKPKVAF